MHTVTKPNECFITFLKLSFCACIDCQIRNRPFSIQNFIKLYLKLQDNEQPLLRSQRAVSYILVEQSLMFPIIQLVYSSLGMYQIVLELGVQRDDPAVNHFLVFLINL